MFRIDTRSITLWRQTSGAQQADLTTLRTHPPDQLGPGRCQGWAGDKMPGLGWTWCQGGEPISPPVQGSSRTFSFVSSTRQIFNLRWAEFLQRYFWTYIKFTQVTIDIEKKIYLTNNKLKLHSKTTYSTSCWRYFLFRERSTIEIQMSYMQISSIFSIQSNMHKGTKPSN